MRPSIKKNYSGFVPAYIPHPLTLCAYYHCVNNRFDETTRYCEAHGELYKQEALANADGATVLEFKLDDTKAQLELSGDAACLIWKT